MKQQLIRRFGILLTGCALVLSMSGGFVMAGGLPDAPGPASGSAGLQGTVKTPAPSTPATIATPANGQTFTSMPITVSGLCTTGLLVKIFSNNVFIGSAECNNGSYTLQVTLFDGANQLVARIFDALDQPGPDSATINVTYNNAQFNGNITSQFTISSLYALRGANPGQELDWPITIAGGTSPYALSVDWGDGKAATLYSEQFAGGATVSHTYDSAGTYVVIIKGTDKAGETAFLQLVGQANGAVTQSTSKNNATGTVISVTKVLWIPAAICIPLIFVAFWLGRRYELAALRRHLERPEDE